MYFLLVSLLAATIPLSMAYTVSFDTPDLTNTNVSNSSPQNIITPLFKGSKIAFTGDETTNTFAEPQSACKGYQGKIQVTCEGPEVDASPPIKQLDYVLNCSSWKILNIQTQKVVAEYCCVQYFAIAPLYEGISCGRLPGSTIQLPRWTSDQYHNYINNLLDIEIQPEQQEPQQGPQQEPQQVPQKQN